MDRSDAPCVRWLADPRHRAQLRIERDGDDVSLLSVARNGVTEVLRSRDPTDIVEPAALSDGTIFAISNLERETAAVVALEISGSSRGVTLLGHDNYDVSSLVMAAPATKPAAATYADDRRRQLFVDSSLRSVPEARDEVLNADPNSVDTTLEQLGHGGTMLVRSRPTGGHGSLTLWAPDQRAGGRPQKVHELCLGESVGTARVDSFVVTSRDGLKLVSYLTRPSGRGPWPLVVTPHGGPSERVEHGFDAQAQYLALRGFASLAVNFRGSAGFGRGFRGRVVRHLGNRHAGRSGRRGGSCPRSTPR